MIDGYRIGSSSWARADKILPLAILAAAGIGCFVMSLSNGRSAVAGAAASARAAPTGGRKIRTEEPMAGYGSIADNG
jgi:predicted membrane-bound mannosyltransferase